MSLKQKFDFRAEWVLPDATAESIIELINDSQKPSATIAKGLLAQRMLLYRAGWKSTEVNPENDSRFGLLLALAAIKEDRLNDVRDALREIVAKPDKGKGGARAAR